LVVSSAYTIEQVVAEMNAIFKAHEERMMAILKASLEEMKSVVEHQKASNEEAAARSPGALKKRHRGRIWLRSATRSQRKGPGENVDPGRD
jgi:Skp family chaperone for outer membrane proteins